MIMDDFVKTYYLSFVEASLDTFEGTIKLRNVIV